MKEPFLSHEVVRLEAVFFFRWWWLGVASVGCGCGFAWMGLRECEPFGLLHMRKTQIGRERIKKKYLNEVFKKKKKKRTFNVG